MDLLFRRYASPFLLLDEVIRNNRLSEFVAEVMKSENERQTWEFYLHKVFDKSYSDFKDSLGTVESTVPPKADLEATVKSSENILNDFKPI